MWSSCTALRSTLQCFGSETRFNVSTFLQQRSCSQQLFCAEPFLSLAFVRNLDLPYTQVDETNSLVRRVCTSHFEREQSLQDRHSNTGMELRISLGKNE